MRDNHPRARLRAVCALTILLAAMSAATASAAKGRGHGHKASDRGNSKPLVIGHRGASGYRPEHTLASYALAARIGADYIEPDLVSTKDHKLVVRHEPEISGTTNVADHPEFVSRKTTKTIDGVKTTGWFTDDFTLAELRTLRAKERLPLVRQRNTIYDGRYQIPTFQEVLDLRAQLSRELHREIGVYPETKHPTYFKSKGLALEPLLVKALQRNDLDGRRAKVFVQSFETAGLREMNKQIDVPLVALLDSKKLEPGDRQGTGVTFGDLATAKGLKRISRFVDGVGPSKDYIIPRDATGKSLPATSFVGDAHAAGLVVHPYTFRPENQFLPLELRSSADPNAYGNLFGEIDKFLDAGVDGFFTDTPDIGRETVDR